MQVGMFLNVRVAPHYKSNKVGEPGVEFLTRTLLVGSTPIILKKRTLT